MLLLFVPALDLGADLMQAGINFTRCIFYARSDKENDKIDCTMDAGRNVRIITISCLLRNGLFTYGEIKPMKL